MDEGTGRIAWITGGGTGIGRELALRLAAHGWTVAISGRRAEPLAETVAAGTPGRIYAFPLDVCDPEANRGCVTRVESELGPIDLAVLNAGIFRPFRTSEFSPEPFEEMMRVNYLGVVNGVSAVIAAMRERGRGHVALMSSVAGYNGLPLAAPYSASKAAVINLAESLRFGLARAGIKVSFIAPGFVRTPLTEPNRFPMPFLMDVEDAAARIERGLAAGRFEIAFPWPMVVVLKLARILPYWLSFPLLRLFTGR